MTPQRGRNKSCRLPIFNKKVCAKPTWPDTSGELFLLEICHVYPG
jgi:hypothetical protein